MQRRTLRCPDVICGTREDKLICIYCFWCFHKLQRYQHFTSLAFWWPADSYFDNYSYYGETDNTHIGYKWHSRLSPHFASSIFAWTAVTQITRCMGPTWVLVAPDGPHGGPMKLAVWVPADAWPRIGIQVRFRGISLYTIIIVCNKHHYWEQTSH